MEVWRQSEVLCRGGRERKGVSGRTPLDKQQVLNPQSPLVGQGSL